MKVKKETIYAGKTKKCSIRATTRWKSRKGEKRKPKINPTPEAVAKNNFRYAIKELTAKLNNNFKYGDFHLVLTYKNEPNQEDAKRHLNNFLRNIREFCKKEGIDFKRIAVTEFENKRIHHHIVCTGIDRKIISKHWTHGWINFKMLDETGNYNKLAAYLVKETEKTFRKEDCVFKRRYSASRNLIAPETRVEEVSDRILGKDLKETTGYYIDQDSIRKYDHAILGVECVEYIEVKLDQNRKTRKRGKKSKLREIFKIETEKQIQMEFNGGEYE